MRHYVPHGSFDMKEKVQFSSWEEPECSSLKRHTQILREQQVKSQQDENLPL